MCEVYGETLKESRRAIQNNRRGMLISGVVLLHDNARQHTAARTRALLEHFNWELFDHPPYNPDLAPRDCHLFTYPTKWLRSQCSTIMKSWWKVSKHGWAHRRQTSLTQAHKNSFRDTTDASIPAVTALRSSLSVYVFFVYNKNC
jgi:peptidoglycan/xylan/chitin deacetylase (PgdA/CDA1 family)